MLAQGTPPTAPVEPPVPPAAGAPTPEPSAPSQSSVPAADAASAAARRARQKSRCSISRGESITEIVCGVIWISMVVSWTNIVSLLDRLGFPTAIPIPSSELISHYYIWIVNVTLVGIAVSILKLLIGRWNFPVGIAHTVYQSMDAMLAVVILNSGMLLRPETAERWAELSEAANVAEILAAVDAWGAILGIIISLAIALDIIVKWVTIARCSFGSRD